MITMIQTTIRVILTAWDEGGCPPSIFELYVGVHGASLMVKAFVRRVGV
jgi:hypothetical protein